MKDLAPANEPWNLIRDAIKDLESQEKKPNVFIRMGYWHDIINGVCHQCLAGSVISERLSSVFRDFTPSDFPNYSGRLRALNRFRMGDIELAYEFLDMKLPPSVPKEMPMPHYSVSPQEFKVEMLELANKLEQAHKGEGYVRNY